MKNAQKTHFIFDVDDTLADSYEFNQQMFVDTFISYVDLSNPDIEKYLRNLHHISRGVSMITQFEQAISHLNIRPTASELVDKNELLHQNNIAKMKMFDAVSEVITRLRSQGKDVSICSNRQLGSLSKILTQHHMQDLFTHTISCADSGHEKPDPFCLETLVKESGKPKEEFIFFGDSNTDYQFATNAGIDCIIVDHYLNQKKFYKMVLQLFL